MRTSAPAENQTPIPWSSSLFAILAEPYGMGTFQLQVRHMAELTWPSWLHKQNTIEDLWVVVNEFYIHVHPSLCLSHLITCEPRNRFSWDSCKYHVTGDHCTVLFSSQPLCQHGDCANFWCGSDITATYCRILKYIFIQVSVGTICIHTRYLYSFYITTCFGHYFWPSSVNIYSHTQLFLLFHTPLHCPMFTSGGTSCVLYKVWSASYRLKTYKYNV
jgi:hypothetical protein